VNEVGEITTVVEDHVQGLAILEDEGLLNAPNILLLSLTLPGIDGDTGSGDGSGGMV
jgi:CheY-like chemotaxis protein